MRYRFVHVHSTEYDEKGRAIKKLIFMYSLLYVGSIIFNIQRECESFQINNKLKSKLACDLLVRHDFESYHNLSPEFLRQSFPISF